MAGKESQRRGCLSRVMSFRRTFKAERMARAKAQRQNQLVVFQKLWWTLGGNEGAADQSQILLGFSKQGGLTEQSIFYFFPT